MSFVLDKTLSVRITWPEVQLEVSPGGVTSVIRRDTYRRTSATINNPTGTIAMQVTNKPNPDMDNEDDWITVCTGQAVSLDATYVWMRFKYTGDSDAIVNVLSSY